MQNKKLIHFVESFVLMPIMSIGLPLGGFSTEALNIAKHAEVSAPQVVLSQKLNTKAFDSTASNQAKDIEAMTMQAKADAIDAYFRDHDMPLAGIGMKMVQESSKYDLDWRLLPAISIRESSGGINACKRVANSFFGYGSCKINFKSKEHAIEVVARSISGNLPSTAYHYANKDTIQILEAYNPRTIVKHYPEQVMAIMNSIGEKDLGLTLAFNPQS